MVEAIWEWVRSWYWLHQLGFHDFGYALRTVNYVTYTFGDADRQRLIAEHYPVCSCWAIRARSF